MQIAILSSMRSKDPITQVGACIVSPKNRIVSMGYNGFPNGISDTELSWNKGTGLDNKNNYVIHAEENAILNSTIMSSMKGCTMYTTLYPCNNCAKSIIQVGIVKVVYISKKDKICYDASEKMFELAHIETKQMKIESIFVYKEKQNMLLEHFIANLWFLILVCFIMLMIITALR
jgi:dCMP deaminase